ncbi:MAG: polysaccharide deacetylase family protein [Clostridium sp.]
MHYFNTKKPLVIIFILFLIFILFPTNILANEQNSSKDLINSPKTVYLTFDDGPDPKITPLILDILKKENVNATFFVVGERLNYYPSTLKRIVSEGHKVGLHSYNHILKDVYKTDEAFINQMSMCDKLLQKRFNIETKIIRFPGGTFKRLSPKLLSKIHAKGYKIYDWHTSVGDGMYPRTDPNKLVENAISTKTKPNHIIVLLHNRPNNKNTVLALPKLIKHYKSLGYNFKILDEKTPEYYFYCK